ncbi:MAG: DUF6240 domain-containing protein [Lutispora sp.]|nr:DUF6240 domain-containing protein [Lutispora sp.]
MSVNNNLKEFNGERLVKSVKIGDVLRGKVVNISEGRLSLKISDEQVLNAAILTDEHIEKGSIIEIIITHMDDDKIYAQIQKSNSGEEVSKDEIPNILKKLGVDATQFNKDVFKTLIKYRQPINKEIIDYINFLSKAAEPFKKCSVEKILNLIFAENDILNTPLHKLLEMPSLIDMNEIINVESLEAELKSDENSKGIKENYGLDEKALIKFEQFFSEAVKVGDAITKADIEAFVFMLSKNIEITPKNLFIFDSINEKVAILSGYIENLLVNLLEYEDSEIKLTITKLKEAFLQPEEFNRDNINTKIKDLISLLVRLESYLEAKGENSYEIRDNFMNLRNTLDFIKSINNNMNYIHIPIILNNQQTDVEIFVYERGKRNKKIDLSNASILICLNLTNIGYIESHIGINNKNVNIVFKSKDRIIANFINYHSRELKEALKLKGYNINISSSENTEEKISITSIEELLNPQDISRYSIDVRV